MPAELEKVNIGEHKVAVSPNILSSMGLGSCVGLCLYDPLSKVGGLTHIMLPKSSIAKSKKFKPAKFADTAVVAILEDMAKSGAIRSRIVAKISGGAKMFLNNGGADQIFAIGTRNIEATRAALKNEGIKIVAEETGGNYGRSIDFFTTSGRVVIKAQNGIKEI